LIIWLSSYPRSGNTFLRTLLKNCLGQYTYSIYNDNDIGSDAGLTEITGHRSLEHSYGSTKFNLTPMRESSEVFFLKTHQPNRSLVKPGDKVIYIIRDGREATLSFHKYLRDYHDKDVSPLELSLGLDFPGGSWSDHVVGWLPKDHDDTLLLYFESVTMKPKAAVDQIANFVGIPDVVYKIPEFKELQDINSSFFRKGKHSSFTEEVSEEAQIFFWLRSFREMRDYGYLHTQPAFVDEISDSNILTAGEGLQKGVLYMRGIQSQLTMQLNETKSIVAKKDQRIAGLQQALDKSNDLVTKMKKSWSWKLTLPLRMLSLFVSDYSRFWEIVKGYRR